MNNVGATHGSDEHRGRVVTFYSYKGGTGRTMALANVAWILASHGKRVMCVDWDLEAPGLHRYFAPFLADPELKETDGLIDWAYDYLLAATEASTSDELHEERDSSPWYNEFTQLDRYATSLSGDFPSGGALYLLGAGRQSSTFSERVNRFNWVRFYEEFGGEAFVNASFENARKLYDYILVDSRTGVADTSGVSTIQVPDDLVVALTLNNQSIYGAAHVAQVALEVRHALELERKPGTPVRQFRVFPLITRVELAEDKKLKQRRQLARAELSSVAHPSDKATYFGEMEVLYVPYYAYDEVLAAISEEPQQSHSMLATYVRLVSYLTNGVINQAPALSAAKRAELLRRYDPSASTTKQLAKRVAAPAYDIFISTAPEDQAFARELFTRLQSYGHPFLATESLALGDDRDAKVARALHECRTHVIVLGTAKPRPGHWLEQEVRVALERADTDGLKVVPVLCGRDATGLTEPYASLGRFVALRTPENSVGQIAAEVARTLGVDAVDVTSLKQRALEAEGSKSELNRAKQETETRLRREIRFRNALLAVAVLAGLLSALYFQRFKKSQSDAALQAQQSTQKLTAAESRIKQSQVSVEERDQWFALLDEATRASAELRRLDVPKSVAGTSMVGLSQITEFMATVEQLEDVTKTARDKLANALKDPSLSNQTRSSLSRARDELAEQALRLPLLKSQSRALAKSTSGDSGATSAARKQAQAIWRKGYAAYLGGRYAEAKAFYEKANAADPTYAPTYNSLGRLQLDQGNSAGAIQVLQKAIDYDADYAPAHNNLAVANLMLAQAESADSKARPRYLDVADKEVKRALELRGEFPEARKTQAAIASMRSTASGDLHQAPKVPTSNATYSSSPKSSNPKTTPKSIDATIPTPYDSK